MSLKGGPWKEGGGGASKRPRFPAPGYGQMAVVPIVATHGPGPVPFLVAGTQQPQ